MGLLTGSVSLTRFNVETRTDEPDFEAAAFREIMAGSEVRESIGFVTFEPDAPYEVGAKRWAFRVRFDKLKPDPTAVRERLKQLIATEIEQTGAPYVGPKKRKKLKHLAEEELIVRAAPTSKIVECCLDGSTVWVASTAKAYVGAIIHLLHRAGIEVGYRAPWLDLGLPEEFSDIVPSGEQSESIHGCRFLKALIGDREVLFEPEAGNVKLATPEARIALTGAVLPDLHRFVDRGAEILSAKLILGEIAFTLDGPSFRVNGLRLPPPKTDHWTLDLDERLTQIDYLYQRLDEKFAALMKT